MIIFSRYTISKKIVTIFKIFSKNQGHKKTRILLQWMGETKPEQQSIKNYKRGQTQDGFFLVSGHKLDSTTNKNNNNMQ